VWPFSTFIAAPAKRRGKRREDRFATDLLTTALGEIVDISGTGARVRCNGRVPVVAGQTLSVAIRSDQWAITVKCRVVRVRRLGLRSADVGLAFVDARPGLKRMIQDLGRFGFIPRAGFSSVADDADGRARPAPAAKRAIPDHYKVLGVIPGATQADIRHAYHQLAHRHHPDAARDSAAGAAFQAIAEAYRVLRDPRTRQDYDDRRAGGGGQAEAA
jgi:hypothetical protein